MKNITKNIVLGSILLLVVSVFALGIFVPAKNEEFARCLSEKDVVMYGTDWCSYCQQQKQSFGTSFQHINYVNCDVSPQECEENDVEGYPTWKIDGHTFSGVQPLERLSRLTQCEL